MKKGHSPSYVHVEYFWLFWANLVHNVSFVWKFEFFIKKFASLKIKNKIMIKRKFCQQKPS